MCPETNGPIFFFAAGHWNYARYISYHILEMENNLPKEIHSSFLRGEHVCRHSNGFWNAVFLDQFGEQTYIRYGKAKGGLVGKSLSSEQVAEWVLSHHICNTVSLKIDNMFNEDVQNECDPKSGRHKEEGKNRKNIDAEDRRKIQNELQKHTNPLLTHPDDPLHNVINGRVADKDVNVDQALIIGEEMHAEFLTKFPFGFHEPLKKKVVTMELLKKKLK